MDLDKFRSGNKKSWRPDVTLKVRSRRSTPFLMTYMTSVPVSSPATATIGASPRVRARRRRVLLASAITATVLAVAMVVADNAPVIGKVIESAWWGFDPATSVTDLTARADFSALDLSWGANDRAAEYTVTVASDATFTDTIDRITTTSTQAVLMGFDQGTTYYYRVAWKSEFGNQGVASEVKPVTTAFHEVTAPAAVDISATASDFSLVWDPVQYATQYVVRMSTSKDPAAFGDSTADVEFAPTTDTTFTTPALSKATAEKYYFTVRADNRDLSTAVTAAHAGRLLVDPPKEATAVSATSTGVTVSWSPVANATGYVIERSSTEDFATVDSKYVVPRAYQRMSINGLAPGTSYFLRIRARDGSHKGQVSPVVAATTLSGGTVDMRVATYNVLDPKLGNTLAKWSVRRKNLAKTINAADADLVALQEAGWSTVSGGRTPAQDLVKLLDKKMVISKAGTRGDQILYSPKKYSAGKHGSFNLPRISGDGQRVAVWQVLTDKKTGASFIAVSTHLTNGIQNNAGRARQAKAILSKLDSINKSGLPLVIMGDMNSYDARSDLTPMSLFAKAGYVDAQLSSPATDTPTMNTWVKATSTTGSIRFDHIAVSESVSVTRTAIEDLKGAASDHRLLWADIALATS